MDFFEYASLASGFISDKLWISYLVGGLCFVLVFIFQSVALYTIAGREGYDRRWMAFVPFFNTYYIGVCGQKNRAFRNVDTRKIALATAILEALLFVGYLVYNIAIARLNAASCFMIQEENTLFGAVKTLYLARERVPQSLLWAAWCWDFLYDYILWWINLIFIFMEVLVISAFFQTYASRRYFLFTITSVLFPIQGILFFSVRNNKGISYREFLYREQERQYRMYSQYNAANPYNRNPYDNYNGQNPYNRPPYNQNPYNNPYNVNGAPQSGAPQTPDDPFGGLGGSGGNSDDPFNDIKH